MRVKTHPVEEKKILKKIFPQWSLLIFLPLSEGKNLSQKKKNKKKIEKRFLHIAVF